MLYNRIRKFISPATKKKIKSIAHAVASDPNSCLRVGAGFICWNQVPGDYLEFGCYSGASFCYAYDLIHAERQFVAQELSAQDRTTFEREKPRFFAFDSFEGLPQPATVDRHPYFPKTWTNIRFAMSQEKFEKILLQKGVDMDEVHIIKGWYHQTLTATTKQEHQLRNASLVNIDCDLYESSILALNFLTDLVVDGTVIVFDDYNFFRGSPRLGERRAFAEWLTANPQIRATELARHHFDKVAFFLNLQS